MPLPIVEQKSAQVPLFIDVINHFGFPQADRLLQRALGIAPHLADLKKRARRAKVRLFTSTTISPSGGPGNRRYSPIACAPSAGAVSSYRRLSPMRRITLS
jgi:hypothetical protein